MSAGARLDHVGVVVADLDAAVAWYHDHFGAEQVRRFERADFGIRAASLRLGDAALEFIQPAAAPPATPPGNWPGGFFAPAGTHHLAIAVDDAAALFDSIGQTGAQVLTGLIEGRFFFCRDPFGTLLEIRQKR